MGGAQAGEVASALAVEQFTKERDAGASAEQQLEHIARTGNREIFEMAKSDAKQAGMGTTLIAAIVGEHDVAVGHVGDSRLYMMRNGSLQQMTHDDWVVEGCVREGRLGRGEG